MIKYDHSSKLVCVQCDACRCEAKPQETLTKLKKETEIAGWKWSAMKQLCESCRRFFEEHKDEE